MLTQNAIAAPKSKLRPLQEATGLLGSFPVYKDLVDKLIHPAVQPDDTVAHVLATCAGYAYSDGQTVADMMARMGLEDNHCFMISEYNDPMFICSTAFLVQSSDGRVVILAYRGTEPVNFINWLTDADAQAEKVQFPIGDAGVYDVHAGFYRNVRATRYKVAQALQRALNKQSVREPSPGDEPEAMENAMEAMYVTGHSLGAAMAAIMAIMLSTEDAYKELILPTVKGVYTYGQPMTGSRALAEACNANDFLGKTVFRYIYARDPVPHLPPKDTGEWANFGVEYQYQGAFPWHENIKQVGQMHLLAEFVSSFASFPASLLPLLRRIPFEYRIDDHRPHHYIAKLTRKGVLSEFGDYDYLNGPNPTVGPPPGLDRVWSAIQGVASASTKLAEASARRALSATGVGFMARLALSRL